MALPTSHESWALHQRAIDALQQRNEQRRAEASAQGRPFSLWSEERPDPNFGMWNDILLGMREAAANTGASKQRIQMANPAIRGLLRVR